MRSRPPAHTGVCARKGVKLPCYPEGAPLATHALIWLTFVASVIPLGTEMPTMDQIILITIGCTFAITLGLLLGLGYYLGRQKRLIDEIGFMVALLLDHLQVPGATCEDCEVETMADLEQLVDVRRNDTLLNPNQFASSVAFPANWQSWDGEQE